jgi:adenylate kinase
MIIFMGVSGAGKGTQSQLLAKALGYRCLSTGELLRSFATPEQQQKIVHGFLLGDDEIITIVETAFVHLSSQEAIILDGFPRTLAQAEWLVGHARRHHYKLEGVIDLKVSASVIHERLERRGRPDDTAEAIASRVSWHNENARPLISYYRQHHIPVHIINGDRQPDEVHIAISSALDSSKVAVSEN